MKTYFIRAEIISVNFPDGEVDVDTDIYEIEAKDGQEAIDTLKALMHVRTETWARGVHNYELVGAEADDEAE